MSRARPSSLWSRRLRVPWLTIATAVTTVLVACGGAPTCETEGAETRVTVDASELDGVVKICIEGRCSTEGDGSERLAARFTEERPERITFEVTLVEGGGQTVRTGGVELNCEAGGREISLIPKADGTTQTVVR